MTAIRTAIQPAIRAAISGVYGSSSAWSPLTLFAASEVGVWYDPSDFSTMYQDSAGTTPVTAVGDPVGKILDKSGNGKHALQATAASRPVLQIDGSGKYYLDFDGTDDYLVTSAVNFTATDAMSVFIGVRAINSSQYGFIVELGDGSGGNTGIFSMVSQDVYTKVGASSKGTVLVSAVSGTNYAMPFTAVMASLSDISADALTLRINGGADILTSSSNQGTGNYGNYPLYFGWRISSGFKLGGRIYSMIIRGATATAEEIAAAEAYVAGKTGVVLP